MTLEQLRIFIAVAEREHVTRAAEALHLTQSATSAAVAALENRHGVALFHRVGRRIELTQAGQVFLAEARTVVARAEAAELALAELGELKRGTLSVQASQTIASYWLPRRLVAFRQRHPGIEVKLAIGNTAQVARAVLEGTAELGFVEGAVEEAALAQREVDRDRLVVVVAPTHPWAAAGHLAAPDLAASDLAGAAWVLREVGSGTRSEFEAALRAAGIAPAALRVVLELPSNEAVRAAVEAGAGATALSELVAEASLLQGTLCRAPFALPERPFQALRHRERRHSRASEAFMAIAMSSPAVDVARFSMTG